jgi:hypothetical protein
VDSADGSRLHPASSVSYLYRTDSLQLLLPIVKENCLSLKMEALRSFETPGTSHPTRRHIRKAVNLLLPLSFHPILGRPNTFFLGGGGGGGDGGHSIEDRTFLIFGRGVGRCHQNAPL